MSYLISLDGVFMPVTPSEIEFEHQGANKTVSLVGGGEFNIPKKRKLLGIKFTCLLPGLYRYPFAYYQDNVFQPAVYYIDLLNRLQESEKPFKFVVSRDKPGIREQIYENDPNARHIYSSDAFIKPWILRDDEIMATLEDFTEKESFKNGFDVTVDIKLKQARKYTALKLVQHTENTAVVAEEKEQRAETKAPEKSYTIQSGDTLFNIAKKELNDGGKWTELYELNKDAIEADAKKHGYSASSKGHWIFPGLTLKLVAGE